MRITFITTGGTIDKDYGAGIGTYDFTIGNPIVSDVLQKVNPNFKYDVLPVLKKDSLDFSDSDRSLILDTCVNQKNDKIIITHGTDTLVKTAAFLSTIENKVIVILGATKPEKLKDSDASFNIGCAVGAINFLKNGVYVAMNGRIYDWDNCVKDKTGQFKNL